MIDHGRPTLRGSSTLVHPPWKHTLGLHRVGQTHLDFYTGYRKKFSSPRGIAAKKLIFNDKETRSDDDELTVYGINAGTGEIFYNKSMLSLGFFGSLGAGAGQLQDAVGVSADRHGNVFVADRGNHRVVRLRNEHNDLRFVDVFNLAGSGHALKSPSGVALEGDRLYITDTGNNRVVVTDLDGMVVKTIGRQLREPFGIAVIATGVWNYYGVRFVVVTDSLGQRLTKLSPEGGVIAARRFGEISGNPGGFNFVAIDYYANVYVTDTTLGCIYKFDRHLNFLTRFGCGTGSDADLVEPRGIAIYRRYGQVFVAEAAGASYFWMGTDVLNLSGTTETGDNGHMVNTRFLLTEQSYVTIRLESETGEIIKTFCEGRFMSPGRLTRRYWIATTEVPCPVAKCTYFLTVEARPTYSSNKYHSVERRTRVRGF